jgi:ribonuclease VapC
LIIVDTSALMAILLNESDSERYRVALARAERAILGAPTKLELMLVTGGRNGAKGLKAAQSLLDGFGAEVVEWSEAMADIAAQAFLRFGKGQKHPARLNFGDCMAYALAKSLDAPLLYKGGDFALTDVRSAL